MLIANRDMMTLPAAKSGGLDPFRIYSRVNNNQIAINRYRARLAPPTVTLKYSVDGVTWSTITTDETTVLATIDNGDTLFIVGEGNSGFSNGSLEKWTMSFTGNVDISGHIVSLLDAETSVGNNSFSAFSNVLYPFEYLFFRESGGSILDASGLILPTDTVAGCYKDMFRGELIDHAPELTAETLAYNCYTSMFSGCTHLQEIITHQTSFNNCTGWVTGLGTKPEPGISKMFHCPSVLGTDSSITRGDDYCPNYWTVVNDVTVNSGGVGGHTGGGEN